MTTGQPGCNRSRLAATADTRYPQEIATLTTRVLEQLDSGALEGAALAFVQLEQKARGASFLEEIRQKLDAGFKRSRAARGRPTGTSS